MTVTEELRQFHDYAVAELSTKADDVTLEDLLRRWRASRERELANEGIRRGLEDLEAGRYSDAEEFVSSYRQTRKL